MGWNGIYYRRAPDRDEEAASSVATTDETAEAFSGDDESVAAPVYESEPV